MAGRYHYIVSEDSIFDLRWERQRAGYRPDFGEFQRLLEDIGLEEYYKKSILLSLVTVDDRDDMMAQDDDCHVEEEEEEEEEEGDPEYELILKRLEEMDTSYMDRFERGLLPLSRVIDMEDDRDSIVQIDEHEFYQNTSRMNHPVAEGLGESVHPAQTREKNKARGLGKLKKVAGEGDLEINKKRKKPDRNYVIHIDELRGHPVKTRQPVKGVHCQTESVAEGLGESVHPAQTREINKEQDRGKLKKVAEQGDLEINKKRKKPDKNYVIHIDELHGHPVKTRQPMKGVHCQTGRIAEGLGESVHPAQTREINKAQDRGKLKKVAEQGDLEINKKTKKPDRINVIQINEPHGHPVKTRQPMKGIHSQTGKAKCAKCSMPLNKSGGKCLKGERNSKIKPSEVEILDPDMVRKGMYSHFVPAHDIVMDEDLHLPRVSDEFRKDVMKVLRRPFNKKEYRKGREKIRDGSYTFYHPDLQTKLTKYRYNKEKCLIVVRGFLFWLQNMTREGSFEPWKDKECLEVELP